MFLDTQHTRTHEYREYELDVVNNCCLILSLDMAKQIVFLQPVFSRITKFVPKAPTTAVIVLLVWQADIQHMNLGWESHRMTDVCLFLRVTSDVLHPLILPVFPSFRLGRQYTLLAYLPKRILQYYFCVLYSAVLQGNESLPLNLELILTLLDYSFLSVVTSFVAEGQESLFEL